MQINSMLTCPHHYIKYTIDQQCIQSRIHIYLLLPKSKIVQMYYNAMHKIIYQIDYITIISTIQSQTQITTKYTKVYLYKPRSYQRTQYIYHNPGSVLAKRDGVWHVREVPTRSAGPVLASSGGDHAKRALGAIAHGLHAFLDIYPMSG